MTPAEIARELEQERQFHKPRWRPPATIALCSCGKAYVDIETKFDVEWRHEHHVHFLLERLKDQLEGGTRYAQE
jgi:hypothetical protein